MSSNVVSPRYRGPTALVRAKSIFKKNAVKHSTLRVDPDYPHTAHDLHSGQVDAYELTYDLLFVAVANAMADALYYEDVSLESVGFTALFFVCFFWTWVELMTYHTRFVVGDMLVSGGLFFYFIGVLAMGLHVIHARLDYQEAFAISLLCTRVSLLGLYVKSGSEVPRAQPFVKMYAQGLILACVLLIISIFVPPAAAIVLWLLNYAVVIVQHMRTFAYDDSRLPIHIHHSTERFSLFVILILGESIITLMTANQPLTPQFYGFAALAFYIVYLFKILYYQLPQNPHHHPLDRSPWSSLLYAIFHLTFTMSLLGLGIAMKMLVKKEPTETQFRSHKWFLIYCLLGIIVSLHVLRLTIQPYFRRKDMWIARLIISVAIGTEPLYTEDLSAVAIMGLQCSYVTALLVVDWLGDHLAVLNSDGATTHPPDIDSNAQYDSQVRAHDANAEFDSQTSAPHDHPIEIQAGDHSLPQTASQQPLADHHQSALVVAAPEDTLVDQDNAIDSQRAASDYVYDGALDTQRSLTPTNHATDTT